MTMNKNNQFPEEFSEVWEKAGGYAYPEASENDVQWNALQAKISARNLRITHRPLYTRKWFVAAA